MILLETDRLRLRNLLSRDAEQMLDYRNTEICARFQKGQVKDSAGIQQLIDRHKEDAISGEKSFLAAIALKSTDELIGEIVVIPNDHTFSLGYTVSYKHHRKGYAFEALHALIQRLHEQYPDWEFISFTHPENIASMNLLKKLGYKPLGYVPSIQSQAFGKWITKQTEEEFLQVTQKP